MACAAGTVDPNPSCELSGVDLERELPDSPEGGVIPECLMLKTSPAGFGLPFSTRRKSSALLRLSLRVALYSQLAPSAAFECKRRLGQPPLSGRLKVPLVRQRQHPCFTQVAGTTRPVQGHGRDDTS